MMPLVTDRLAVVSCSMKSGSLMICRPETMDDGAEIGGKSVSETQTVHRNRPGDHMPAARLHLVRHGEVDNPEKLLYGRLDGFPLSDRGREMAASVAAYFIASSSNVTRVISSPLLRTLQSAAPIARAYSIDVEIDERLIEASSRLEGRRVSADIKAAIDPANWRYLINPFKPSWGEAFASVADRMVGALTDAWESSGDGDVVLVSHELPIWIMHRIAVGKRLPHDPRKRRCARSSVTTFEYRQGTFFEAGYAEPAVRLADA